MKILFDHLQKTGGTAVLEFLRCRLDDRKVSPLILHESIRFAANLSRNFDIVGGHLDLSPAYDWPRSIYHVTVLRDPIERFLSHYCYAREQSDAADPFSVLARRHDIPTLLRLADEDVLRTAKDFYIQHFAEAFDSPVPATAENLFAAIERRYHLIGISERSDDVARILCMVLGLEPTRVARVRVTGTRLHLADLDPATRALLLELTAGDRALYKLAAERFDAIARSLGIETSATSESILAMDQPQHSATPPTSDPSPGSPRVLAAELSCPETDTNDCALSGADCVLAFQIDPGDAPLDPRIELRITNALHQMVYRENRLLDLQAPDDHRPLEVLWRFVCPLGPGLYRCSVALGLVKLKDVYEFSVIQPPQSPWAGLVDLRPTVAVIEHLDASAKGLAGSITSTRDTLAGDPGSLLLLPVTIRNEGVTEWLPEGVNRVRASYRLYNEDGVCVVGDGMRTILPMRIGPDEVCEIMLRVTVPAQPGHYSVTPKLVRERVAWFGTGPSVALQAGDIAQPDPVLASDELGDGELVT